MKFIEEIKKLNILDEANSIELEELVLNKKTRVLTLSILLDNAISLDSYKALYKGVYNIVKPLEVKLNYRLSYKNDLLSTDEYREYLEEVLARLIAQSPRFKILSLDDCRISGNNITFLVAHDALGVGAFNEAIEAEFALFGLGVAVQMKQDEAKSIARQIELLEREKEEQLRRQQEEALAASRINKAIEEQKKAYKKKGIFAPEVQSYIKSIPSTSYDLNLYENEQGVPNFLINAYVFGKEIKTFPKTKSSLCKLMVTDDTDSIVVNKWLKTPAEKELYENDIVEGTQLRIIGKAIYDNYAKDVILDASSIEVMGKHKEEEVSDDAPVKRVELHAHSKMSTLDGLTDAEDYIKTAAKWGWKAMAITDHDGVYAIPDIAHAAEKLPDFKPIYGVELSYVDDSKYFIAFDQRDIDLKTATYVVFDIETTGLSQEYDRIIEIAAHKVSQGGIISQFEEFVNPERSIPEKITELTSITNEMVKNASKIEEVLPRFLEFCKGCVLVAHNARFDVGFIYNTIKKLGLEYEVLPAIDTLNLFRAGYNEFTNKFNLKALAKHFKIKQEHHHRASDDTRVTALCFISMLNDLYQKGITNYKDINSLIDPNVHWKFVIPSHLNIIAKTQEGYKNMYKILSDALTNHFYGDARALKSVIEKYRDGILLGSGCANGDVFEAAINKTQEDLEAAMSFFDYIEVQPLSAYAQVHDDLEYGVDSLREIIFKIIDTAKKLGKLVVATSDCHYLRPSLKQYRDIMIASPQIGGGVHPLNKKKAPSMHLRTTNEMLEEFDFIGKDLAYEIVVENTNKIADSCEKIRAFHKEMFAPKDDEFKNTIIGVDSIIDEVRRIVTENVEKTYGSNPHPIVSARIKRELDSIISNGYASVYYMSHLLVVKSLNDGYLVGSRGSVGSSLVATMMDITEINPLSPHYRCKKCKFHTFKMTEDEKQKYGVKAEELELQNALDIIDSGYDLPDAVCPICGEKLAKDGHDIPFETFLGFDGDKVPDIDLNFSGEYQAIAHEYVREVFGSENAFRGGTVGTIAEKNAYGYVKGYCERREVTLRSCEMERIAKYLIGIKRSTGQHPGGIVVVPHYVDIYDVTPVQYPADNTDATWRTTHYDYHAFENNLLKLDILGHDDPTMIKYFMDYVKEHQEDFPFTTPQDIPVDDRNVYRLFNSTDVINVKESQIGTPVASYAVPEFGTNFVRQMLVETSPSTFAQLVKISGLSHGTGVWATNAQDLVGGAKQEFGKIEFKDVIGCRDDIMVYLLYSGLEPLMAFEIMEFVRKGRVFKQPDKWVKYKNAMIEKNVPAWYIWSCEQIQYMFPKAHATAYVLMALRIAWFKVYSPALFYSAWFSKRAKAYDVNAFMGGELAISMKIEELKNKPNQTAKDEDLITALQVALEMTARKIKFLPVDIEKSDATIFKVENGNLRLPFIAIDKLGESVAEDIVQRRNEKKFTSKKDVSKRTKLNSSLFEEFNNLRVFGNLPEADPEESDGLFAFSF